MRLRDITLMKYLMVINQTEDNNLVHDSVDVRRRDVLHLGAFR